MKIALVSGAYPRRDVVARGVSHKLGGTPVQPFSCCEDLLASSMDYQAFIVYNNFDHKMSGVAGVREIRKRAPRAFIIGVSPIPYMERQFLPAGADAFLLLSGNEIAELYNFIFKRRPELVQSAAPPLPQSAVVESPQALATSITTETPRDPALQIENLIIVLERVRLLLDYALTDPKPAEIHLHLYNLIIEIENIIMLYYTSRNSTDAS